MNLPCYMATQCCEIPLCLYFTHECCLLFHSVYVLSSPRQVVANLPTMTEEEIKYSKLDNRLERPCEKCGRFGHIKFECRVADATKILKPQCHCCHSSTQRKRIRPKPSEREPLIPLTTNETIGENLIKPQKSKPTPEPALKRTVVMLNVPTFISNLKSFTNALMQRLDTKIKPSEYNVTRPWARNYWRDREVQILFKSVDIKLKFDQKITYCNGFYYDPTANSCYSSGEKGVRVEYERETISVKFTKAMNDESNKLLNKALNLKLHYYEVKVFMWREDRISIWMDYRYYAPDIKDKKDISKARTELNKVIKRRSARERR